ncbi:hypothetical protein GCM10023115_19030 [Pontixanthobacter gangjinensis]|uniref:Cell division protein ZapA n=1 Tax=Pontixanthobacter gangjinensis TaxID=1028742 RepID=A0A6I4SRL7_9SPHN|nr:cell division protein ZapA [Pontixanthobacter gangjinensis]MXO57152.1 cell division protein ZapA [Pontixanthobacter gangjinensis]
MSEVKLSIAGRDYTVACAEGEEAHVISLGGLIDEKLGQLRGSLSSSESQNLLFGALFLADELHEARKTAASATAKLEAQSGIVANAEREANLAKGKQDDLKLTVARLEEELDGLQSAQQRQSAEANDIRIELESLREKTDAAISEKETLASQVAQLTRERDTLIKQIQSKDLLLERANALVQESKARAAPVSAQVLASSGDLAGDPELAPSLERFADLLENCADKLESKAPAS